MKITNKFTELSPLQAAIMLRNHNGVPDDIEWEKVVLQYRSARERALVKFYVMINALYALNCKLDSASLPTKCRFEFDKAIERGFQDVSRAEQEFGFDRRKILRELGYATNSLDESAR